MAEFAGLGSVWYALVDGTLRTSWRGIMDPASVFEATRVWSVEERLDLISRMWDDLVDQGWQFEPSNELLAELDRRMAAHEANPNDVRTEEQVLARIRKRK